MWPQIAFNVDCGYLEGLVRGFKSGILKQTGKGGENVKWSVVCEPLAPSLRILRICLIRRTLYPLPYYFSYFSFSEYLSIFSLLFECFHFALATFYPLSALTTDYLNLVQCETLEDLKLHLASTDYGNFLANEAGPLSVNTIDDKLKEKLVVEFQHMRNQVISYIQLGSGSVIEF